MFEHINPYTLNDIPEIKLSYHPYYNVSNKRLIFNSERSYRLFSTLWNRDTINLNEEILVAFLNHDYKVIGIWHHAKWTSRSCPIDIRKILSVGLKSNAAGIIIAHNHPETSTTPSDADKDVTKQLEKAASLCWMKLVDHIIISTEDEYFSFADANIIQGYSLSKYA